MCGRAKPNSTIPEGEGHGVKAPLYFAEEGAGRLHLQAVLFAGVPLVDGGPLAGVPCLGGARRRRAEVNARRGETSDPDPDSPWLSYLAFSGTDQHVHRVNLVHFEFRRLVVLSVEGHATSANHTGPVSDTY